MLIIMTLFMLVIFILFSVIILTGDSKEFLFMLDGDIIIPAGAISKGPEVRLLNPITWVFGGIFILLYLKIIWKLVSYNWKNKASLYTEKQKLKRRLHNF
jgi:hypothetical protein